METYRVARSAPSVAVAEHTEEVVIVGMNELSEEIRSFIDKFTGAWELMRGKRITGRVLALLLITDEPHLTSSDLCRLLETSPGTISTATRTLLSSGYIAKVSLPGSREACFRAEDDVWGAFLSREKLGLQRMGEVLGEARFTAAGSQPGPSRRLRNGSRYMIWVDQFHRNVLTQWQAYRDQDEDAPPPQSLPAEMTAVVAQTDQKRGEGEQP